MSDFSDFASLMEGSANGGPQRADQRLAAGQIVEAVVLEVASDWVFVDVGTPQDGRIERGEFGGTPPKRGDRIRATVLDPSPEGTRLTTALGQGGGSVDISALELAREGGTPVVGEVVRAVKGGLEVKVGGTLAFCPASQIELGYASELDGYVGQTHEFKVLEVRDEGRSVVLSRRRQLEDERRTREAELLTTLKPGSDVNGVVTATQRHGALLDLAGATGFVHISELAPHRVERVEDVLKEGEQVQARVLSVEPGDKGLRIRLSLKQLSQPVEHAPRREEILEATVAKALNHGVLVDTSKGSGFVPLKELGLAPGADHRRAFPTGKTLRVVLLSRDSKDGKLRFSAAGVAGVEERRNYKEFSEGHGRPQQGLGSLGDVLRRKLGLPEPAAITQKSAGGTSEALASAARAESPRVSEPGNRQPISEAADPDTSAVSGSASTGAASTKRGDRSRELGVVRRSKPDA